jgi:WhiB family redox-sensing transcriptional regulator
MSSRPDWMTEAKCAVTPDLADLWFSKVPEDMAAAKRICRACPVQRACLELSLTQDESWGVWGGISARSRKPLRMHPTKRFSTGRLIYGSR